MGHALNASTQDVLIRWHRMRGFNVLWQPGYDHASIAVHAVIERQLLAEGTNRYELGRDAFVERTWRWLEEYGGIVMGQLRKIGASLDYSRERFTMDDDYIRAVLRFFVHLERTRVGLQGQPDRELVPGLQDVGVGSRGRPSRHRRRADDGALSARGRIGLDLDRDCATADDSR